MAQSLNSVVILMNDYNLLLSNYLINNKLTQADFCRKTGYDKGQVSKWIKGINSIGLKTVWRIQKTFPDFAPTINEELIQDSSSSGNEPNKTSRTSTMSHELTPLDNWKSVVTILGMIESLKLDIDGVTSELQSLQLSDNSKIG